MTNPIETKLKALATAYHALLCAVYALSDGPGTWTREQDQLQTMAHNVFNMDYELGYEYRDEQRDQRQRDDVTPDPLDYWQRVEAWKAEE